MNVVDIIILAVLSWAVIRGYKKGLAASFARLAGYFFGLVAAVFLSAPLAGWLDGTFNLAKGLTPWLHDRLALPAAANTAKISQLPFDKAAQIIKNYDLPDSFKNIMLNYIDEIAKMPVMLGINNLSEAVAHLVGSFMLTAAAFLVIYGVVSLLIGKVIPSYLLKAGPRPVKKLDHLAGAILGGAGATISVAVTIGVIMPVFSIGLFKSKGSVLSAVAVLLQESKIANMFMQTVLRLIT